MTKTAHYRPTALLSVPNKSIMSYTVTVTDRLNKITSKWCIPKSHCLLDLKDKSQSSVISTDDRMRVLRFNSHC